MSTAIYTVNRATGHGTYEEIVAVGGEDTAAENDARRQAIAESRKDARPIEVWRDSGSGPAHVAIYVQGDEVPEW